MLVEFHQHATGLHIIDFTAGRPDTVGDFVDVTSAALSKPPSAASSYGAVDIRVGVVVAVWSTEHSSVGDIVRLPWRRHRITGVSAVPGHRQLVLTNLITDSSRKMSYLGHIYRLSLFYT